jgi:uncharacterized protein YbbK (DUF523 family)
MSQVFVDREGYMTVQSGARGQSSESPIGLCADKAYAREVFLVSACLLGIPCAYDGRGRPIEELLTLATRGLVVPVCPEVLGGLPIPRPTAEIVGGDGADVLAGQARVVTVEGGDVTDAYVRGAEGALAAAGRHEIATAILRQCSPSCGNKWVYDGTHSGNLKEGQGVTAALLRRHGMAVWSEDDLSRIFERDDAITEIGQ